MKKISTQGRSLPCGLCEGEMPVGEMVVWSILQYASLRIPSLAPFVVLHNDYTVKGTKSSADFTICCGCTGNNLLIIMVDGAGHVHSSMYGRPLAKQRGIDRSFDALAYKSGLRVLRLHCSDSAWWGTWVMEALSRALRSPTHPFVMYTLKYGMPHM